MPDQPTEPEARGILRLDQVSSHQVAWLWPGRIPLGKLTLLDGDPGLGKSTLLLDLAARLTTARPLPDQTHPPLIPTLSKGPPPLILSVSKDAPATVALLSAEDSARDTIRPRLEAAGADLQRVYLWSHLPDALGGGLLELPRHARWLDGLVAALQPRLLIIDPLVAYLGPRVNAHHDQQVRRALFPLVQLAERHGLAVVVVRHLSKRASRNPLYRGGGSIGLIGAARSGLIVAPDPDDPTHARRVLASTKSNLGPCPDSLAYRLVSAANGAAAIQWEGPSPHSAATILADPPPDATLSALAEARTVLAAILAAGPLPADAVLRQAAQAGVARRTLHRAKAALGVRSIKQADCWTWALPSPAPPRHQDARTQ